MGSVPWWEEHFCFNESALFSNAELKVGGKCIFKSSKVRVLCARETEYGVQSAGAVKH